eukprot:1690657-Rhodomonas_salina.6
MGGAYGKRYSLAKVDRRARVRLVHRLALVSPRTAPRFPCGSRVSSLGFQFYSLESSDLKGRGIRA